MTVRGQTMPRDGMEIVPPAKAVRRKRSMAPMTTKHRLPASGPIGGDADETGASRRMSASAAMPLSQSIDGGRYLPDNHESHATTVETGAVSGLSTMEALPLSQTIADLRELQKTRQFCIKSQSRCDRSVESFIARFVGYRNDLEEKQRTEIFKQAAAMRKAVEKAGAVRSLSADIGVPPPCIPIIQISANAREAWDKHRAQTEKEMRRIAKTLAVYPWAKSVKGLGDLGLGIIIGETGDLANYATKERVWKRLGLAVIEGERQQRRSNVEQAAAHGYSPKRRAEIWTLADSMFKHQWRGAKEDQEAGPAGPYGVIYAARKAHTVTREGWTLAHRDADARRIMMKAVIADLWTAWRDV